MTDDTQTQQLPSPDPALRRLDRFVGTWKTEGHLPDSDEIVIKGETTFPVAAGGLLPRAARHDGLYGDAARQP
jgi:hypothetical protein